MDFTAFNKKICPFLPHFALFLPHPKTRWGNFGQRQTVMKYIRIIFFTNSLVSYKKEKLCENISHHFLRRAQFKVGLILDSNLNIRFKKIELMFENQTQSQFLLLFSAIPSGNILL